MDFAPQHKWQTPFFLIFHFFRLISKIHKIDAIVCQFAGFHSVFPVLLAKWRKKPCLIVAGGTECAYFPQIGYGNFRKKWLGLATCFSLRNASIISPVHKSMVSSVYSYSSEFPAKQGILNHCVGVDVRMCPIPNGFNSDFFVPSEGKRIPRSFVTMAFGIGNEKLRVLKGVDLIIEVAPNFPDCEFVLVGADGIDLDLPDNVKTYPAVDISEVPELLSRYECYFQLSISEGFPNALCEAMLCGCVPVGSNVTSIPEIISDSGFVLENRSVGDLKELIKTILKTDLTGLSVKARKRIKENYPAERRKKELNNLLSKMITSKA